LERICEEEALTAQKRRKINRLIFVLPVLLAFRYGPQAKPQDLAARYPDVEGVYEMAMPGRGPVIFQVYFKDGTLRTVQAGDASSTTWLPVEGAGSAFKNVSQNQGTFVLTLLADEQGRYTKFRVVNEQAKMDLTGIKKSPIEEAKADPASPSDRQGYFERHYRKSEHLVPMRDGVRLLTQVYHPLDSSELHPILILRTPYGIPPYGEGYGCSHLSLYFGQESYILVLQDIRGTGMSEGEFEFVRPFRPDKKTAADIDESSDAFDTVEWLLRNVPRHSGKVGVWGVSYPGFAAAMAALSSHPAVVAVSPQAPMADLFLGDDGHHLGAFYLAHYANYLYSVGRPRKGPTQSPLERLRFPTPDGYDFFLSLGPLKSLTALIAGPGNRPWSEAMAHETYDDYWKARSIYPHLRNIKPAILMVGGWWDGEDLHGTLETYRTVERENPGLPNTIIMGPWAHSKWHINSGGSENRGAFAFQGTRTYFHEKAEVPFFNYYLKGKGALALPEAVVFETGTDQWRTYAAWPPAEAADRKLFLGAQGRAAFEPGPDIAGAGFDEYISDPAKPVPHSAQIAVPYNRDYFVEDQRFAASRPDVLVYTGEPLAQAVTISGPIKAELYVSTTGTDADWVVKVIDVYPNDAPDPRPNPGAVRMGGYQRLVRGEVLRGKFRNSFEKPEPFIPGRVTQVQFELPDVQHAFLKGHRIMVQVQSSWFPLIDRNPQRFCNIRTADEKDFQKATQRIYRGRQYPSGVIFKVLPN
jgi:putative CocE/NonD family hydrolase